MSSSVLSPDGDLNQVIVGAVNARIEAAIAQAMNGDESFNALVVAALRQEVEVPKGGGNYGNKRVPFLNHLVQGAIREAAKGAVQRYLAANMADLEAAVAEELERATPDLARQIVGQVGKRAAENYGVTVNLRWPGE